MKFALKTIISALFFLLILPVILHAIRPHLDILISILNFAIPFVILGILILTAYKSITHFLNKKKSLNHRPKVRHVAAKKRPETTQKKNNCYKGEIAVVRHFLELYALQLNEPDAPSEIIPLETDGLMKVYELRVKQKSKWSFRRMSIGSLGEEAASRSKCYYVIFDDHLVVKIPPQPIQNFIEYIENIKKETFIIHKLELTNCVVPNISVILKRIHSFPNHMNLAPDKLEEEYIQWVSRHPNYQAYLTINTSFVYFMDLSKNHFLSHAIDDIHNFQKRKIQEIMEHPDIIWNPSDFEGRYGKNTAQIYTAIQEIYTVFKEQSMAVLDACKDRNFNEYHYKDLFLAYLAEKKNVTDDLGISKQYEQHLDKIFKRLAEQNRISIQLYQTVIDTEIKRKSFAQRKIQMESIISNLLKLLAWLSRKKVSIRDLKPDNILLAGEHETYPEFLSSFEKFSLGLIDIETAVVFEPTQGNKILQPLLGGTPFYATPSHLFHNALIEHVFQDLAEVFQLQDWYAVIAISFKIITGEHLFEKTGTLFPSIKQMLNKTELTEDQQTDIGIKANHMFWQNGIDEFKTKRKKYETILKKVNITFPFHAKKLFLDKIEYHQQQVNKEIKALLDAQTIYHSDEDRHRLQQTSLKQIHGLKIKWENGKGIPNAQAKIAGRVVKLLQELEELKYRFEKMEILKETFQNATPVMSAYDTIFCMYSITLAFMFKNGWALTFQNIDITTSVAADDSWEATI